MYSKIYSVSFSHKLFCFKTMQLTILWKIVRLVALPSEKSTVWMHRITVAIIDACCSADLEQLWSVATGIQESEYNVWCLWSLFSQLNFLPVVSWSCDPVLCNWNSWNMYTKVTRQFRNKILAYLDFLDLHKHTWLVSLLKYVIIKAVK